MNPDVWYFPVAVTIFLLGTMTWPLFVVLRKNPSAMEAVNLFRAIARTRAKGVRDNGTVWGHLHFILSVTKNYSEVTEPFAISYLKTESDELLQKFLKMENQLCKNEKYLRHKWTIRDAIYEDLQECTLFYIGLKTTQPLLADRFAEIMIWRKTFDCGLQDELASCFDKDLLMTFIINAA